MDFKTNLINSIGEKLAYPLLEELEQERQINGLVLNTNKIDSLTIKKFYPDLEENLLIPNSFYFNKNKYDLGKSLLFNIGAFYIQDPSSNMVANLLQPKENEQILDMCGAPGGKSINASLLLKETGLIVSNDISYQRSLETSKNVERMGLGNIAITCGDLNEEKECFANKFDKIILDAPCSGSAMFRKNKKAREDWTYQKVLSCQKRQLELLDLASMILKKGGIIAYSTCSFSIEEDEDVIISFLKNHNDFKIMNPPIDDKSFFHHPKLDKSIRLLPSLFKGEGQFVALLKKEGDSPCSCFASKKEYKPKAKEDFINLAFLNPRSNILIKDNVYSLSRPFNCKKLDLIRYGIEVESIKDRFIPSYHLAKAIKFNDIPLSLEQTKKYLLGETFTLNESDGYHTVSYENINLGFIKISSKIAKNHYPKGLRRNY